MNVEFKGLRERIENISQGVANIRLKKKEVLQQDVANFKLKKKEVSQREIVLKIQGDYFNLVQQVINIINCYNVFSLTI